jgi:hypothetical protein
MDFGLNLRYAFLNEEKQKAYVNAEFGFQVELTNSNITTKEREPLFRDLNLSTAYNRVVYQSADKETKTSPQVGGGIVLPTSLASRRQGKYIAAGLSAGIIHQQKLAGSKATWFQDVLIFGTFGWSHWFSRATTPVYPDLDVPRQRPNGASFLDDQLSGYTLDHDRLRVGLTYFLSVYKDVLSFNNTWRVAVKYKYDFHPGGGTGCDVSIANDPCVIADRAPNYSTTSVETTFDISLSYNLPQNLGRVDLGYLNEAPQLGYNGQRRSVFYSPDAQFYLNLVADFDGIYDKASRRSGKKSAETKRKLAALPRYSGSL